MNTKTKKCVVCGGNWVVKKGKTKQGKQLYYCRECKHRFTNSKQLRKVESKHIWIDFVFKKQVTRELKETYEFNRKTILSYVNSYEVKQKKHKPRPIHLLADALYFGSRLDGQSWCVVVFRDPKEKENLWWTFTNTETESVYIEGKLYLEKLGYTILSVTGDGFGGLRRSFILIPYQMCLVHMKRIVVRGTTNKPKLIQGQILLALAKTLFNTKKHIFEKRLNQFIEKYRDFLNEKAVNQTTGEKWFIHEDLRRATMSLLTNLPYLFTYENDPSIPKTTNSLEGHFSHLRDILEIHRGASKELKQKIIHTILLASTIAPDEKKLKDII